MFNYDAIGTCVLVLTLGTILVIALVVHKQKSGRGIGTAVLAALTGILLGVGGTVAGVQMMGFTLTRVTSFDDVEGFVANPVEDEEAMELLTMGGMMGNGEAGSAEMGGGDRARLAAAKRKLTTLVRKIDLLTGNISLKLSEQQSHKLLDILERIKAKDAMSDEDATELEQELVAVLTADQAAKPEAVGLPKSGGTEPPYDYEPIADVNPFEHEANSGALDSLLDRFGESGPAGP